MIGGRNNKAISAVSTVLASSILIASCSVDMKGVESAFENLGNNIGEVVSSAADTAPTTIVVESSAETETAETSAAEVETVPTEDVTPEPTAVPTSTPAPSPSPSPTPEPERVDFSELTTDHLTDTIDIETEDFEESFHAEDNDHVILAGFNGNRVLLSGRLNLAAVTSVNLLLDAFYAEAEGLYNRYVNEQNAAYTLDEENAPDEIVMSINYDTYFNGRLLGVIMSYEAVQGDTVLVSSTEYVTFDLYTGQYVIPEIVYDDPSAFFTAVATDIASQTEDRRDRPADYEIVFVGTDEDDEGNCLTTVVAKHGADIEFFNIDIEDYVGYMTRFGRIYYRISDPYGPEDIETADDGEVLSEEGEDTSSEDETAGEDGSSEESGQDSGRGDANGAFEEE